MGYPGQRPSNYLVWAIITIFLCWPFAIPAIVFAAQVNSKFNAGDFQGAEDSSRKARTFALISTILGGIIIVIYIVLIIIGAVAGNHTSTGNGY
jgi:hypothetical protein